MTANGLHKFDYYPFGMGIKEREWKDSSFSYRFAFNGKEQDNEVSGRGNSYDFGARIYDSRLGRFLSRDPWEYKYTWQTPYAYYKNSPIAQIDYKGKGDDKRNVSNPNNPDAKKHKVVEGDRISIFYRFQRPHLCRSRKEFWRKLTDGWN